MAKTYTVHEVLYDLPSGKSGPAGDGTAIMRFSGRAIAEAKRFAATNTCRGRPAELQTDTDVPKRLAERWGCL